MKVLIQEDKDIARAHEEYQHFIEDDNLREIYEQRQKWQLNYNTDLEIARNKGREEGIEKGMEKEKIGTVLNMHKNGFDVKAIMLATNLSEDKIRSLISELKKDI